MSASDMPNAPRELIDPNGRPRFGNFAGAVARINHKDFDFRALRRWPWTASSLLGGMLFKRWQFVGAIDENLVLGAAVVHLNYVGSGFAYVYDRRTGTITEKNLKAPLARSTRFSESPVLGISEIRSGDRFIRADNTTDGRERRLQVDFGDELRAEVQYREPGSGVSTACEQAVNGFHYTYKSAGLPASGRVVAGGKETILSEGALALLDWTASTPPRETTWNWAAGVGSDEQGRPIGINFSKGLVSGKFTQNAVWIDGNPHMQADVRFEYDGGNVLGKPWQLTTADGVVNLVFSPDHERYEKVNFGIIASSLHQPFGTFEGTVKIGQTPMEVRLFGFCEEHYAKW